MVSVEPTAPFSSSSRRVNASRELEMSSTAHTSAAIHQGSPSLITIRTAVDPKLKVWSPRMGAVSILETGAKTNPFGTIKGKAMRISGDSINPRCGATVSASSHIRAVSTHCFTLCSPGPPYCDNKTAKGQATPVQRGNALRGGTWGWVPAPAGGMALARDHEI